MLYLIVDDHTVMRCFIRQVLSELPVAFLEAGNGLEACQIYREHRPDRVIMDVGMPEMDGLAATRWILRLDPQACIVLVTLDDSPQLRREGLSAGARMVLPKEELYKLPEVLLSLNDDC